MKIQFFIDYIIPVAMGIVIYFIYLTIKDIHKYIHK